MWTHCPPPPQFENFVYQMDLDGGTPGECPPPPKIKNSRTFEIMISVFILKFNIFNLILNTDICILHREICIFNKDVSTVMQISVI